MDPGLAGCCCWLALKAFDEGHSPLTQRRFCGTTRSKNEGEGGNSFLVSDQHSRIGGLLPWSGKAGVCVTCPRSPTAERVSFTLLSRMQCSDCYPVHKSACSAGELYPLGLVGVWSEQSRAGPLGGNGQLLPICPPHRWADVCLSLWWGNLTQIGLKGEPRPVEPPPTPGGKASGAAGKGTGPSCCRGILLAI